MKRSEMKLLIANQLLFIKHSFKGFTKNPSKKDLNDAEVILATIEAAGMVLAQNKVYNGTEYNNVGWEPENE